MRKSQNESGSKMLSCPDFFFFFHSVRKVSFNACDIIPNILIAWKVLNCIFLLLFNGIPLLAAYSVQQSTWHTRYSAKRLSQSEMSNYHLADSLIGKALALCAKFPGFVFDLAFFHSFKTIIFKMWQRS